MELESTSEQPKYEGKLWVKEYSKTFINLKSKELMGTKDIAIKYGVPTPETCRELDWKEETYFYWCEIESKYELCFKTRDNIEGMYCKIGSIFGLFPSEVFPAPQMHEIAIALPKKGQTIIEIVQNEGEEDFLRFCDDIYSASIWLDLSQNHYAEAYAELYIKLRKEQLL